MGCIGKGRFHGVCEKESFLPTEPEKLFFFDDFEADDVRVRFSLFSNVFSWAAIW